MTLSILNDIEITRLAIEEGMIEPFVQHSVRQVSAINELKHVTLFGPGRAIEQTKRFVTNERKLISYGLGSYGYDIRLSEKDFRIFRHIPGTVINPKRFNPDNLESVDWQEDQDGRYFIIPGHSYGLGVAVEKLKMPANVIAFCLGKSTYARTAIIANVTPAEAGWEGHLTLEFSNASPADTRIYANEGVVQLLFFRGELCKTAYNQRIGGGKYQGQSEEITLSRV